ncbi:hypothetical protein [Methylophilus sp. 14]|uniref:hypothetical protein n=1 Tax=Methylophilus sp. 14 TaxID=2781019 RepID=UPI001890B2C3|nr:hypothetical protein [Methylophilus sp. 14]MBF4986671.1 hypothetical protein [Methylophilus sp. 14]
MWRKDALLVLLLMGACMQSIAADATRDGRVFQYLSASDVEQLDAADKLAYKDWADAQAAESSSTEQASDGPNTMDLSSDFSM